MLRFYSFMFSHSQNTNICSSTLSPTNPLTSPYPYNTARSKTIRFENDEWGKRQPINCTIHFMRKGRVEIDIVADLDDVAVCL